MRSLILSALGAALLLAATATAPAAAAPLGPLSADGLTAKTSNLIDVRSRGWAPPRRGWGGGPRWGYWRGGPRFGYWRGPRRGWGPRYGYGYGYPGWAWAAPLLAAPFIAAPYWNNGCGYVTVRRWSNGRAVWVREYVC